MKNSRDTLQRGKRESWTSLHKETRKFGSKMGGKEVGVSRERRSKNSVQVTRWVVVEICEKNLRTERSRPEYFWKTAKGCKVLLLLQNLTDSLAHENLYCGCCMGKSNVRANGEPHLAQWGRKRRSIANANGMRWGSTEKGTMRETGSWRKNWPGERAPATSNLGRPNTRRHVGERV